MSYMHDLRAELEKRLVDMEVALEEESGEKYDVKRNAFIKFILEKVLESYNNGRDVAKSRVDKAEGERKRAARMGSAAE